MASLISDFPALLDEFVETQGQLAECAARCRDAYAADGLDSCLDELKAFARLEKTGHGLVSEILRQAEGIARASTSRRA